MQANVAQVLYDFEAQNPSELSISTGEVLTILKQDVGEGWWEGVNAQGKQGLFPEAYVQLVSGGGGPPNMPLPPLPPGFGTPAPNNGSHDSPTRYNNGVYARQPPVSQDSVHTNDDFDEEWSDDDQEARSHERSSRPPSQDSPGGAAKLTLQRVSSHGAGDTSSLDDFSHEEESVSHSQSHSREREEPPHSASGNFGLSLPSRDAKGGSTGDVGSGSKTVRLKNMNRFSNFVKSGVEGYILNATKVSQKVEEGQKLEIVQSAEGPMWSTSSQPYTCRVDSPKKSSKLKGLKSFIAYQLTPSFTGIQVSRRYKHFDWLHKILCDKYVFISVPPLPEKQVSGRYEDEFIEHRMALLQLWVNKICRHPVLSHSEVWLHFITCPSEDKSGMQRWKQGKRKAEKDEYVGGNLFMSIVVPPQPLDPVDVDNRLDNFARMARALDDAVKNFFNMSVSCSRKMQGPYKKEYMKIGAAFRELGQAFDQEGTTSLQSVSNAIKQTGDCYDAVAGMFAQQPRIDLEPLADTVFAYKGMLALIPDIIHVNKAALSKLRDHQKLADDGKISQQELESLRSRVDVISYAMLAEMNYFQRERVHDFGEMISVFLEGQIKFYQGIAGQVQKTLSAFH